MIYSKRDQVINVENAESTLSSFSNARTEVIAYEDSIDPSEHVLFGYGSPDSQVQDVANTMARFILNTP